MNFDPDTIYRCDYCHLTAMGEWPHPVGTGCPEAALDRNREQQRKDEANEAYIAKLNAERDASDAGRIANEASAAAWDAQREYYERQLSPPTMFRTKRASR